MNSAAISPAMITVQINGESRCLQSNINITELVHQLALAGKKLAVERNGELIPRSTYGECRIADGDRLEIVVAVGGG
jgi:sulfur carrier protein